MIYEPATLPHFGRSLIRHSNLSIYEHFPSSISTIDHWLKQSENLTMHFSKHVPDSLLPGEQPQQPVESHDDNSRHGLLHKHRNTHLGERNYSVQVHGDEKTGSPATGRLQKDTSYGWSRTPF